MDRKLEKLESALSARDRAKLSVAAAARGEDPDERLDRYCPPADRPEYQAIKDAARSGVHEIWQRLLFEIEWLNNDEVSIGWLECLAGFLDREKALKKLAGAQAKALPPVPPPGRGFIRGLPLLWGVLIDPPEAPPASWDLAVPFLKAELRKGIEIRWRGLVAYERSLASAAEALGVPVGHPDVFKGLEAMRSKLLELHAALQKFEPFELPEPGERETGMVAGFWDFDVLREKSGSNARAGLWDAKRTELEEWEREQAEGLRAR